MVRKRGTCPHCNRQHDVVLNRLLGMCGVGGGLALGANGRNPEVALIASLLLGIIGVVVEEWLAQRCPDCGAALTLLRVVSA